MFTSHSSSSRQLLETFQDDLAELDPAAGQCLLALSLGASAHVDLLSALFNVEPSVVTEALAMLRATELVDAHDTPLPAISAAVQAMTPWQRRLDVLRWLVSQQLQRGASVLTLVQPLLTSEMPLTSDDVLAQAFEKAADEALGDSPSLALRLLDAAVACGASESTVVARRAHAALQGGDLDTAQLLADQVIMEPEFSHRSLGVRVAATALAHRGLTADSAEMCRWAMQNASWPGDLAFGVIGFLACGRVAEAEELLASASVGPPTAVGGAVRQLAEGMHQTIHGAATTALSTLVRGVSLTEGLAHSAAAAASGCLPDSPAALTAIVALHSAEGEIAGSMLDKALAAETGGPLLRVRHRLLSCWQPLLAGDTVAVSRVVDSEAEELSTLGARDRLLATALRAGVASRNNDTTALGEIRRPAREAMAEHGVDLFTLLPLGELLVATARLREHEWLRPYEQEAWNLLDRLGRPALWSALLHWRALQAQIVLASSGKAGIQPGILEPAHAEEALAHEEALTEFAANASHSGLSLAPVLAQAARSWVHLLEGRVDPEECEQAARALHGVGFIDDGARLAGQAALHTQDRKAMLGLLECARSLQGKPARPRAVGSGGAGNSGVYDLASEMLSEREREVAELVLSGMTYKQIGSRLFISAKTVEHHISRIKQRMGADNREELLARLRQLLGR